MRVLLSCLQSSKRQPIPAYNFWRKYFTEGCKEAGLPWSEVPGVDWTEVFVLQDSDSVRKWKDRTWNAVLEFVRKQNESDPITMFLSYLFPKQIDVSAIAELKRIGIPCANFFCDNVREFRKVPREFSSFDLNWVPEYEATEMYENAGLPYLNAPMPCWIPSELRSVPEAETEPPTFIGSMDVLRRDLFARAIDAGAELVVRGVGWSEDARDTNGVVLEDRSLSDVARNQLWILRAHGVRGLYRKVQNKLVPLEGAEIPRAAIQPAPSSDEYLRITREAVITLGVNRVPTLRASHRRPLTYSRLRDIEAPMLGACYLTESTTGLSQLYELGEEIEIYKTAEELTAKINMLKQDPVRRQEMRQRAQRRALNDHSIAKTLTRIIERLSLRSR